MLLKTILNFSRRLILRIKNVIQKDKFRKKSFEIKHFVFISFKKTTPEEIGHFN